MIILSSGNLMISAAMTLGLNYSAKQKTLETQQFISDIFSASSRFIVFISAPITFIISIIYGNLILLSVSPNAYDLSYLELFLRTLSEFNTELILYALFNSLCMIYVFLQSLEEAMLNITKAYALTAAYTISNSILVPLFYLLGKSLLFVLLAWNLAIILTILIAIKDMILIMKSKATSFNQFKSVFHFGIPSLLIVILNLLGAQLTNLIIFVLIDPMELPDFFLSRRFLSLGIEFIVLFFSGIGPILVRLKTTNRDRFVEVANSLFRILPLATTFVFTFMTINSSILGRILVGSSYDIGGILFLVIALSLLIKQTTENFFGQLNALGLPKKTLFGEAFRLTFYICVVILLLPWGVVGVAIAIGISELITSFLMFLIYRKESPILLGDYVQTFLFIGLLLVFMISSIIIPSSPAQLIIFNILFLIISYVGFNILKPLKKSEIQLLNRIMPQTIMTYFYRFTTYRTDFAK